MKINPYLFSFDGQCQEAFEFYAQTFGGRITNVMTYGESPMGDKTPPERRNKILHARLVFGDNIIMGGDAPPDHHEKPQGFAINISVETAAAAERLFKVLSEGGTVRRPMEETFWAVRFGMALDRFGMPWMINCEKAM